MTLREEQRKVQVLILAGLVFSLAISITLNRIPFIRAKSDLYQRWYATTKLFTDNRNLYDERNGEEVLQIVYGDNPIFDTTNFYYPAHLLVFTGPLALLPYQTAHLIWTTAVQLFYLGGLWLLSRELGWPDSINKATLFMVLAALFLPSLQHTIWGQFNTIGTLSLALCYLALRKDKYGWAGIWAIGLTFKPQATLLLLLFLLGWALWQRHWRFLWAFTLTGLGMWGFAEFIQPGWVFAFIESLDGYIPLPSVVDNIWNPNQLVAGGLVLIALVIFKNRNAPATSWGFAGSVALATAVWMLIIPLVGMMHTVIFPVVLVLLLAGIKQSFPKWYNPALLATSLVYLAGWVGFLWGLSNQELYGQHIFVSEFINKAILPALTILFALPFCLSKPEVVLE